VGKFSPMVSRMAKRSQTKQKPAAEPRRSLVSRSSILILSGFLVGLGLSRGLPEGEQSSALIAAGFGLLSFFLLDGLSRRRALQASQRQIQLAIRRLEKRIGKHVGEAQADAVDASRAERQKRDLVLRAIMSRGS
jgi:hypothetical protein